MRILITGAGGQVGSELVLLGSNLGHQMVAASHAELDITTLHDVRSYVKNNTPDLIINSAAYTAVDKAEEQQVLAQSINADGPAHLAQVCAEQKIPLLHISTDYVFDGEKDSPYCEDDVAKPQGVYGASKLAGEQAIANILDQHLILRVAWVFGASGQNFVRTMLRLGKEHDELRIVGDQVGGPTWAYDIAAVLLRVAEMYGDGDVIPWGTYHYQGNPAVSWAEFAKAIFVESKQLGLLQRVPKVKSITTAEYPTLAKRPQNSVLNCQKIKQWLNLDQPDWRVGLKSTLQSWKES